MTEAQIQRRMRTEFRLIYRELQNIFGDFLSRLPALTISEATKYNRLAKISAQLEREVGQQISRVRRLRVQQNVEKFFEERGMAIDELKSENIGINFTKIDGRAVREIIANPFDDLAWRRLTVLSKTRLTSALTSGLVQGMSFQGIANEVKRALNVSFSDAMRIARTETRRAENLARSKTYAEALSKGVEGEIVWVSALQPTSREPHKAMDGKVKTDKGYWFPALGTYVEGPHRTGSAKHDVRCMCRERFAVKRKQSPPA